MPDEAPKLRWGVEQRLEFIEFRLYWEGGINRSDLTRYFGVSVPQASKDLSQYQALAPENVVYDRSQKRYFASASFTPRFLKPDASRYLSQLRAVAEGALEVDETWLASQPRLDAVELPHRHVDPEVLRATLEAARAGTAIEIRYQSLSDARPSPIWRWISPHAFAFDGHRWHARAFCHIDRQFKDFLLSRFLKTRETGPAAGSAADDAVWNEIISVAIKPHPMLSDDQQRVVAQDYGMRGGKLTVKVRLALLYYWLRRVGLDPRSPDRAAREQHVVLANSAEVTSALDRAQFI